jgi:UDP-N-acetylglucosamine 1-carboxyvinyltransferase
MIEGSWIGLAAMTRSEITIKDVSWDNLGVIPSTFRKIGITLERRVMIFISRRMKMGTK